MCVINENFCWIR